MGAPDQLLSEFIGEGDPEEFWRRVDSNFKAGRIKLVFVADNIPRELARIVEFMNDQMRADVRAIELRWFSDGMVTTLNPRVIGETERAAAAKAAVKGGAPVDRAGWITKHLSPFGDDNIRAAERFVQIVEGAGGRADVASTQGSIYAAFSGSDGKPLYPFNLWTVKAGGQLSLSLGYLAPRSAFADQAVRQRLYDRAVAIFGSLSTKTLNGFPGTPIVGLNDPKIADGFRDLLEEIVAIGGNVSS